jgi:hypothetical protein
VQFGQGGQNPAHERGIKVEFEAAAHVDDLDGGRFEACFAELEPSFFFF